MSNSKELRVGKCPYKFEPLEDNARIKERFLGYDDNGLVRSVPEGWTLGGPYEKYAEDIYNFELRDDDAWVVTYPKSGAICYSRQLLQRKHHNYAFFSFQGPL